MMRTTPRSTRLPLRQAALAALLLCAVASGDALAQARKKGAPAAAESAAAVKPSTGFLPPAAANAHVIDSVYVIVNDEVITKREVDNRVNDIVQRARAQNAQLPDMDVVRRQVVEQMISERAQLQLAKEMGVRVDDTTLDRAIGRVAEGQKMTVQDLRNQLEKEGMAFSAFREQIRNEIAIQQLTGHEVDSKIQVSDAEIDTYLAAQKAAAADKMEVDLSQIVVRIPENATPEQIAARKARADEVVRQLRTGADFAKMAATYSDAPDALKGGAIGWRDIDQLPPLFANELRKLKPGQVTPVIRTNFGFQILKLGAERKMAPAEAAAPSVVQQTHARHILLKVTPAQTADDAKKKLAELRQKIEAKQITFEDAARQNSQDGAAVKGGDLGWLEPGDTVPEFETPMNGLKVGEVSDVVQSPYGFHLIQVIERKSEDTSKDKERAMARQVLTERKREEALQDWTRQVRDRAYVEFREDQ